MMAWRMESGSRRRARREELEDGWTVAGDAAAAVLRAAAAAWTMAGSGAAGACGVGIEGGGAGAEGVAGEGIVRTGGWAGALPAR